MPLTRELPSNKVAEKFVITSALTDIASANYVVNEMRIEDFTDIFLIKLKYPLLSSHSCR